MPAGGKLQAGHKKFKNRFQPLSIMHSKLSKLKLLTGTQTYDLPSGRRVAACGIVTARQQPPTAKGVVFITREDEISIVNVIVWKSLREQQRSLALKSRLLAVYGVWQRKSEQINSGAVGNVKNIDKPRKSANQSKTAPKSGAVLNARRSGIKSKN